MRVLAAIVAVLGLVWFVGCTNDEACANRPRGSCGQGMWCEDLGSSSRCEPVPANRKLCGMEKFTGECTAVDRADRPSDGGVDGLGSHLPGMDPDVQAASGGASGNDAAAGRGGSGGSGGTPGGRNTGGSGGAVGPDAAPATDAVVIVVPPPVPDASAEAAAPIDVAPACMSACTMGATTCSAAGLLTCVMLPTGCAGWSPAVACGAPQTCPMGKNECTCPKGCEAEGAQQCSSAGLQTCVKNGECLVWDKAKACPAPQTCPMGKDACQCPGGASACTKEGAQQCGPKGVQTCTKDGACLSWVTTKPCAAPETCTTAGDGTPTCGCGAGNFSCPSGCRAPAGACVAIWFATPNGNGPPADCVHRSEGICRENECDLSIQKKRYIQPPDNIDALASNCQSGGHFEELFAAVCAETRARNTPHALVDFFVDIYDSAGAWKTNRWLTNKFCP
jgi:hypothetical protein